MNINEVENEIAQLKLACIEAGVQSFNRFYFDNRVIFNVTTKEGFLASAQFINGKLVIRSSRNKA
jgi:hypothetical protein